MILIALILCLLITGCAESTPPPDTAITGSTMGTRYHIKVAGLPRNLEPDALKARIDEELERINDQMSTYRPSSEISRFNRSKALEWFPVSPEVALVVEKALKISRETGGAFDVTVGPLVNLWGFGAEERNRRVPDEEKIEEIRSRIGYQHLEVRRVPPGLKKRVDEIEVDLSAIAKGFGVDRIAELLTEIGIQGFLVEIGGEIRTRGGKADGSAWTIGIEKPVSGRTVIMERLQVRDMALATSGDYRNFFTHNGRRLSHTIDPRTGRPVEHDLASVSVLATSCMHADAWATALMVLGPENGIALAARKNVAAHFIVREGSDFNTLSTEAFATILK